MEATKQLMLFTEASRDPAKTFRSQASKRDCPVIAPASGSRCLELFPNSDPVMLLLRTCVERSISPSILCKPEWRQKVTKSTLTSYQHLRLVRPTKGKDCSLSESGKMSIDNIQKLWRTPDANCDRGPSSAERMAWKQETGMPISLNDQVAHCGLLHPSTETTTEQE